MTTQSVSVVICTFNRADSLEATLESLRYQSYPNFEVVVVNGPSTDHTESVIAKWRPLIKAARCDVANLSVSRNIGIRATGGDLVAFIDDDALPDFDWLLQLTPSFEDDATAGAGGIVFDHTGMNLQYRFSAANRFAEPTWDGEQPFHHLCFPGSFEFPYLQGTNAVFRRSALLTVGGFDETYEYYLDETDLCCRLIDAGFLLKQLPNAAVHHKFLPSDIRNHERVVTNWFPVLKNQVYFSYRHALGSFSEVTILEHSMQFLERLVGDARFHEEAGRLAPGTTFVAQARCAEALRTGLDIGARRWLDRLGPVDWQPQPFHRFATIASAGRRKLTLVSSGYPPNMTGGIARFIGDIAPELARRGHEVRVITKGAGTVDLEDGVWVHRVTDRPEGRAVPEFPAVNGFASAALEEIERIGDWTSHDVVYGPLWDVETIGILRYSELPCLPFLATPVAVAADMAGLLDNKSDAAHIRGLMALENEVLATGDLLHAISDGLVETLKAHYPAGTGSARFSVAHIGLAPPIEVTCERDAEFCQILFVGRFEVRKGIDLVLAIMPSILDRYPNVRFVAAGEDRPLRPGERDAGESWLDAYQGYDWSERVRFEGRVDDRRLHELYASSDIVVLPSRYESFGLAMVEAMAHGSALVSSDVGGIREIVRHQIDGLLIEPGDARALEAAVRTLIEQPDLRRQLGEHAKQRYTQTFHIEPAAERFIGVLSQVTFIDAATLAPTSAEVRTRTGHRGVIVRPREPLRFDVSTPGATLCLAAPETTTVTIAGSTPGRVYTLPAGLVTRIPVQAGPVLVTAIGREVRMLGAIVVAERGGNRR